MELSQAAAAHPGRAPRGRRRRGVVATSKRTSSPRSSCSRARCSRRSPRPTRSCCSSTRSTASSSRPRRCCSRSSRSTRCRSPSSAPCAATQIPMVFLTSNNTRELSEALKRRCLYLLHRLPRRRARARHHRRRACRASRRALAEQIAQVVRSLRALDLKKAPSVSETLDWARTLVVLGPRGDRRRGRRRDAAHLAQVPVRHRAGDQGAPRAAAARCLDLLGDFIGELRAAGIPVSMSEHVDAARAMEVDRPRRTATLVQRLARRDAGQGRRPPARPSTPPSRSSSRRARRPRRRSTDDVDDRRGRARRAAGPGRPRGEGGGASTLSAPGARRAALPRAARRRPRRAAPGGRRGGDALRRHRAGPPVGGTYYLYRTLRNLDLEDLEQRLTHAASGRARPTTLAERLARDEARARIEQLKREIEREIRERLVEDRGAEALAKSVRKPLPEDLDVMHANRDEMAQLERALRPLSRKLAVRLARRRRRRHRGPVDLRHTVRRSLSTGGVPIDLRFKPPRPAKPEIFVIADVSGSVASFARFTLHLVHAISSQFSKVRSFVFVDGLDEVTRLFEGVDDPAEAVARINAEADVIAFDGHSDYGRALAQLPRALRRRTSPGARRSSSWATRATTTTRRTPRSSPTSRYRAKARLLAQPRAARATGTAATRSSNQYAPVLRRGSSSVARCASSRRSWASSRERPSEPPRGFRTRGAEPTRHAARARPPRRGPLQRARASSAGPLG